MSDIKDGSFLSLIQPSNKIGIQILSAAINFFILSCIFILTLRARLKNLYLEGDKEQVSYNMNAFIWGIIYALIAAVAIFVIDIISGNFATLMMIPVYLLSGLSMLILSLIAPSFLSDVSAYKLWSISFWPIFIVGMLIALTLGAFTSYLGARFSKFLLTTVSRIVSTGDFKNIDIASLFTQ